MTPSEIGLIFNQLVSQRAIYSGKIPGRRRSKAEIEVAEILEKSRGDHAELDDFLETQGLLLKKIDAFAVGLGNLGNIYIALRNPALAAPAHLAPTDVLQELIDDRRRSESKDAAAVWASFLLLTLFYFLYTMEGRSIEAISGFLDSAVDQEEFIEEVRTRIENMRTAGIGEDGDERKRFAHETLTGIKDSHLESRARSFFLNMIRLKVLEPTEYSVKNADTVVYRQSLWSAVDTASNFARHLGPIHAKGLIDGGQIDDVLTTALPEQDEAPTYEEGNT